MKFHDIWSVPFSEVLPNYGIVYDYCKLHNLPKLVGFHMIAAVDTMENTACVHMRFKYPDCNVAVTRNDHLKKYMFELHVPIFH